VPPTVEVTAVPDGHSSAAVTGDRGAPPPDASATASAAASDAIPALELVPCPLDERGVNFLDCNPKPSQQDYPECYSYTIEAASPVVEGRCIPEKVTVTVSGWPGVIDVTEARAVPGAAGQFALTLAPVSGHPPGASFPKGRGAALGTLVVEGETIAELRRAKGLAHYTDRALRGSRP
jgi:hypothetical protein